MGTDIHSIVQVRKAAERFQLLDINDAPPAAPGEWVAVGVAVAGDPRSYNTFAMLADVRNGRGFAGIKTSDGFPVIHEPRGLPSDLEMLDDYSVKIDRAQLVAAWDWGGKLVSANDKEARRLEYMEDATLWLGDHSYSWATLAELQAFVANVASKWQTRLCGVVDREEYLAAKAENRGFESWCGAISGPGVVIANEPAADEALPECSHVRAYWTVPAMECSCLGKIIAALEHVRATCGVEAENVRYVFGFDS